MADEPAFIAYGYSASDFTRIVHGGFDHNGDGYDDLLISSYTWADNDGGFGIIYGQPDSPGGTLCDPEFYLGVESFAYMGQSTAVLGDLDSDGCDDLAVGASSSAARACAARRLASERFALKARDESACFRLERQTDFRGAALVRVLPAGCGYGCGYARQVYFTYALQR